MKLFSEYRLQLQDVIIEKSNNNMILYKGINLKGWKLEYIIVSNDRIIHSSGYISEKLEEIWNTM